MNGVNLFEQQAMQLRFREQAASQKPALREISGLEVLRYIERADLDRCHKVAIHLSARLFTLEKQSGGMKASNLNEAAHFAADAATDIAGAMQAEDAAPCACGGCDSCVAARSDEHYDRRRDGTGV